MRSIRWVRSAICSDSWRTCSELAPPPAAAAYPVPPPASFLARVSTAATTPCKSAICCSRRSRRPLSRARCYRREPAIRASAPPRARRQPPWREKSRLQRKISDGRALCDRPCPVFWPPGGSCQPLCSRPNQLYATAPPPFRTVTARLFCDQQEMLSQTATGRSLP